MAGIQKSINMLAEADILLLVTDATNKDANPQLEIPHDKTVIQVVNKCDLKDTRYYADKGRVFISAAKRQIEPLINEMQNYVSKIELPTTPMLTHTRYKDKITLCITHLQQIALNEDMLDISAHHLQTAALALSEITGKIDVEEILDSIFSSFCIGK